MKLLKKLMDARVAHGILWLPSYQKKFHSQLIERIHAKLGSQSLNLIAFLRLLSMVFFNFFLKNIFLVFFLFYYQHIK